MINKEIDLSIVIVSTNIEELLRKCLKSVFAASKEINIEIIDVDNASTDNTPNIIAKEFPQVKLIKKSKNHGFGENNNFGIKIAKGRYVLLLNSDTELIDTKILKEMVGWMDSHPKAGIVSCGLLNPDRKSLQGSGGYFPTLLRVFAWMSFVDDIPGLDKMIQSYHPHLDYYKREHQQDWVTGAFFLMRKNAMDSIGIFDEDFFLYVEEVDLSYRFKKAGWEVWYLPQWKIIHYGQMTNGSEKATIFEMQNLKLFYKKHYPKWQLPFLSFALKLGVILRIILFGLVNLPIARTYAKALTLV